MAIALLTRSLSADQIANVNFLCARGSGYVLERKLPNSVK